VSQSKFNAVVEDEGIKRLEKKKKLLQCNVEQHNSASQFEYSLLVVNRLLAN
jgi:hypothetical protein